MSPAPWDMMELVNFTWSSFLKVFIPSGCRGLIKWISAVVSASKAHFNMLADMPSGAHQASVAHPAQSDCSSFDLVYCDAWVLFLEVWSDSVLEGKYGPYSNSGVFGIWAFQSFLVFRSFRTNSDIKLHHKILTVHNYRTIKIRDRPIYRFTDIFPNI